MLTQITTFLEYSPNKKDIVLSPSPVNAPLGGAGMEATPLTVKHTQDIHSDLSSLYSRSHVTTLAFSAFSEGMCTCSIILYDNVFVKLPLKLSMKLSMK